MSDEAKDLIRKMIVRNPFERLAAEDVGKHLWFAGGVSKVNSK